jgi:hypothetical protein
MSNTKHLQFNLNNKIRVRLTDKGRSHLRKLHQEVCGGTVPYNPPNKIDGWTEFKLWDFIGKFGEFCQTPGLNLPFSPGIELIVEDDDLFEDWYILNAFDYGKNPVGSRECGLQRKAWMAAKEVYQEISHEKS